MTEICINWKKRLKNAAFQYSANALKLCIRFSPIILLIVILSGCGIKPPTTIPVGMTVTQAIDAIERQSVQISDFTGKAFVKASIGSSPEQTANVSVKFLQPDNFRLNVKGFAGITLAIASAVSDSITIYVPSENAYLLLGRNNSTDEITLSDVLRLFVPLLNVTPERIVSIFNGILPKPFSREDFRPSIKKLDGRAVLTLENGALSYRFTLEGHELMVVEEEILEHGVTVWHKSAASFQRIDGVVFPRIIRIAEGEGNISLEFSDYAINTGLNEGDCTFAVPESAERLIIGKYRD